MKVEEIIENLKRNGSKFDSLDIERIRKQLISYIAKDYSKSEIDDFLTLDLKEKTEELLYGKKGIINGISTSIYLSSGTTISILGGNRRNNTYEKIDENTLFDIASITKLYFGLLMMKLNELGIIDLNAFINNLTDSFDLKEYRIDDLINMRGIIKTKERVDSFLDEKEALSALKSIYIENADKSIYNYTDMGVIVLTIILEEMFGISYDEILKYYLLDPLGLNATYFPKTNVTGNGRNDSKPHDPKTNALNKSCAHAGLFVNSSDLIKLSNHLFEGNYLPVDKLREFCINKSGYNRGIFGSFVHHSNGLSDTYVPNEYSRDSFAYEGFTGSVVVFDLINKIHNSILVNAIDEASKKKSPLYRDTIRWYQEIITEESIKLLIIDRYFIDGDRCVKKLII